LCPDGTCLGIIGSNGRCTVCGTADPAGRTDPAPIADDAAAEPENEDAVVSADTDTDADADADVREDGAPAFDPKRRLCEDDTCIGVIGSDQRCSVCGKPART
jgi:hypothetical protein